MRSRLEIIEVNRKAEEKEKRNKAEDRRAFESAYSWNKTKLYSRLTNKQPGEK